MGSAQFDRPKDRRPRAWAEAYLDFAAGEMRSRLHAMGHRLFPVVGWAERPRRPGDPARRGRVGSRWVPGRGRVV